MGFRSPEASTGDHHFRSIVNSLPLSTSNLRGSKRKRSLATMSKVHEKQFQTGTCIAAIAADPSSEKVKDCCSIVLGQFKYTRPARISLK